ncbi:MAG: hypothetical protein ED557_14610 [Balneola sp.]|nr:MAG: hypothetical protein ED557_14610 [Balneola sp.]
MYSIKKLILLSLFFPVTIYAQDIGSWNIYTSTRTVTSVSADENANIWISSTGGVEHYNSGDKQRTLTTLDGLSRLDGQTAIYDTNTSKFFVGYVDGSIDVIDTDSYEITNIGDIERFPNFTEKGINDFALYENELYVATDFGIVVFDIVGEFVTNSFNSLGSLSRGISVADIEVKNDSIYCATAEGVAIGALDDELTVSTNWISYDESNGFVTDIVTAIGVQGSRIYASTGSENYLFESGSWNTNVQFGSRIISDYLFLDSFFIASSEQTIFYGIDLNSLNQETVETNVNSVFFEPTSDNIYFGTFDRGSGIFNISDEQTQFLTPDGPYQNFFSALNFDGEILIAASTNESARNSAIDNGKGYYIFENNEWVNVNSQNNTSLGALGYKQAFTSTITDEYYYFGAWGRGVARHAKNSGEVRVFDETNSTIRGWEDDDPLFPVISGLATDTNDDVWLVSRYGTNPLYYQSPGDDDWVAFPKVSGLNSQDEYVGLFIDSFNQKWITLQNSTVDGTGLLVIDTGNPSDASDDIGVKLISGESSGNLPDEQVNAIIQDKNEEVWIGTGRGIARFIFPQFITQTSNPSERNAQWLINEDTSAVSRFLLRDVNVSAMAVNGANEKWIGSTNQGIWVLNAEGSRIEKRFTAENSPLISNNIISIAVNDITGEVFIATDLGLVSYQDVSQGAFSSMKELKVFPNPFTYSRHDQIIIEGLVDDTLVRVLGVDGTVVASFNTSGGRVSWNGLDNSGNQLGTGVYFVVSTDNSGSEKGIGKVVIIK